MAEKDQEFLEFVVRGLVEHPEDVKINRAVDEMGVLLTLDLNGDDMGKVIGRSGNTAKAIRTLLRVVGMKHNARVNLKINEPAGGSRASGSADSGTGETPASWKSEPAPSPVMKSVDEAMQDLDL
jgi:predicted RNA-binding protein YlqC (UPF0109 family)